MSIKLSLGEFTRVVKGELEGNSDLEFSGLNFDSREVTPGNLFIALKGEASDGHNFLNMARTQGAVAFLVNKSANLADFRDYNLIKVDDTLRAYTELARFWRSKFAYPIIGITGSMGKTTTRNMTYAILSEMGKGGTSIKSFNNHTGVPYTLCSFNQDYKFGVVEMGMNHLRELSHLGSIACPNVCAITTVAPVHIGHLGSLENIAKAKLEILEYAAENSPLIVPADNEVLWNEIRAQKIREKHPILAFGYNADCDSWVSNVKNEGLDGISFTLHLKNESIDIKSSVAGEYNALNFAIAALIARTVFPTITLEQIKRGIENFANEKMRFETLTLGNRLIINDAYNANSESIKGLLRVAEVEKNKGKKIGLVLGDVRELGEHAIKYHEEIAQAVAHLKPNFCVSVGEYASIIQAACNTRNIPSLTASLSNDNAIIDFIKKQDYDILFVKGSRGIALETVIENLKK